MKQLLLLFPLVLVGCKAGRQAAVSNAGRIASTVEGGTYVAGVGKVGAGGEELEWSPDGRRLAIVNRKGFVIWPGGSRFSGRAPIAWSPDGQWIAATDDGQVVTRHLATGRGHLWRFEGAPERLRWSPDGRLFVIDSRSIQAGGSTLMLKEPLLIDAAPTSARTVVTLAWDAPPDSTGAGLERSIVRGEWDPLTKRYEKTTVGRVADLFDGGHAGRADIPVRFALAPEGRSFAAATLQIETTPASLSRMKALADKVRPTRAEKEEMDALLKASRLTSAVVRVDSEGHPSTLWSAPGGESSGVTDLAWSADGRWLAIAQKEGTVRVRAE